MKKIFFLCTILFLAGFASAQAINEISLAQLGQQDFELDGPNLEKCFETIFSPTADLNQEVYAIVSVHAKFLPVNGRKSSVVVFLNGLQVKSLKSTEFVNDWGRFNLKQGQVMKENSLKICAKTSFEVSKIQVLSDSKIGYYFKPDFETEGAFEISVFPTNPLVFEEFKVKGVLKNFGSKGADVVIKYRKDSLEKETPETELVKGQTKKLAHIDACMKRDVSSNCIEPPQIAFEYLLRPKVLGPITLLPSIVEFENTFGETVLLESNRPELIITEPEIKIKPFVQTQKDKFLVGEPVQATLLITNEGKNPLYNLFVTLKPKDLQLLQGSKSEVVEIIHENETISKQFTFSSLNAGELNLGCTINYLDYNTVSSECNPVTVTVSDPSIDITVVCAILLVVLSTAIYGYLQYVKK